MAVVAVASKTVLLDIGITVSIKKKVVVRQPTRCLHQRQTPKLLSGAYINHKRSKKYQTVSFAYMTVWLSTFSFESGKMR
jgi:hypothetical protein